MCTRRRVGRTTMGYLSVALLIPGATSVLTSFQTPSENLMAPVSFPHHLAKTLNDPITVDRVAILTQETRQVTAQAPEVIGD